MYIQYPKYTDRGFAFRSDGIYFALAEKMGDGDHIAIYDTRDWTLLKRWKCDTNDLDGLVWSPDGRFIAVWDPCVSYRILIYYPDGRFVAEYSAYDGSLGIKKVEWSPSAQFLTIGSYDGKCRMLDRYTWTPLIELSHPKSLSATDIVSYFFSSF